LLSIAGALLGLLLGQLTIVILQAVYPGFPLELPGWALASSLAVSLVTGLVFGLLPARKAARLNPIRALAKR
jgi:putative ABC transport system permease protein